MRNLWAGLTLAVGLVAGCGNDDGGPIGGLACSIEANFASIHENLLQGPRCATDGCHGTGMSGGLGLAARPDVVFDQLLGENTVNPAAQQTHRVVAGIPQDSFLFVKVSEEQPPGGRMPPGSALAPCEIEAIRAWIEGGARRR